MSNQLRMVWSAENQTDIEAYDLPEGYIMRTFRSGDEAGYDLLMKKTGFDYWEDDAGSVNANKALPGGLFFIVHTASKSLVATAGCFHNPALDPRGAELGWVAVDPDYRGKKLGYIICAAVTARFAEVGYKQVHLLTDDYRLPAIKTYLRLGWKPFIHKAKMMERWQEVFAQLKLEFNVDDVVTFPYDHALDQYKNSPRFRKRHKWLPDREHRAYSLSGDADAFGDESLYKPSRLGRAFSEPSQVEAGSEGKLKLVYVCGENKIPAGSTVTFVGRGQRILGNVSPVSGSNEVEDELLPGDTLEIVQDVKWTSIAGEKELKVVINYNNDQPEQRLPEPVIIEILPKSIAKLEIIIPCNRTGDSVDVLVTARDEYDNRALVNKEVEVTDGKVKSVFKLSDGRAYKKISLSDNKPVQLNVEDIDTGMSACSNYSLVDDEKLFIGDLHCHDYLSEAEGYPDTVYAWAKEERGLDFISVVPQAHGWLDNETWTITKYMNERYHEEGKFITFLGYEWQHTGFGDKVVHYLGGDQPFLPPDDERYDNPRKLYAELRKSDAMIISHHPAYNSGAWCSSSDFSAIKTEVERVIEIWSMHGSSEGFNVSDRPIQMGQDQDRTVMAALRNGLRMGFVAGSDTHRARPGGSSREPCGYWGGLAAVWAPELTRRNIFKSIYNRHTYALTGARMIVKMHVNDALMGSELPFSETVEIRIEAWTPAPIKVVQIVKDTELVQEFHPKRDYIKIEYEDKIDAPAFYHCRVIQEDGHMAVCSPVWIG